MRDDTHSHTSYLMHTFQNSHSILLQSLLHLLHLLQVVSEDCISKASCKKQLVGAMHHFLNVHGVYCQEISASFTRLSVILLAKDSITANQGLKMPAQWTVL